MRSWSTFYLALVLALVFAFLGFLYLVPGIYHPFTADTLSIVLGRIVRPSNRS